MRPFAARLPFLALSAALLAGVLAWPAPAADCTERNIGTTRKIRCSDGSSYTVRYNGSVARYQGDEDGMARQYALGTATAIPGMRLNERGTVILNNNAPVQGGMHTLGYAAGRLIDGNKPKTTIEIRDPAIIIRNGVIEHQP